MQPDMLGLRHDLQIVGIIVAWIMVAMMHNLASAERATDLFLGDNSMLVPAVTFDVSDLFARSSACDITRRIVLARQGSIVFRAARLCEYALTAAPSNLRAPCRE